MESYDLTLKFDGAARPNPGNGAWGAVITDEQNNVLWRSNGKVGSECTSNMAEYFGLINGLRRLIRELVSISPAQIDLTIEGDSQVVLKQFTGEYSVRNPRLAQLLNIAQSLIRPFKTVSIAHIPRELNSVADGLAEAALNDSSNPIMTRAIFYPNLCSLSIVKINQECYYVTNDTYTASTFWRSLIDADFLVKLRGHDALDNLGDPNPISSCYSKGAVMPVLGVMKEPLRMMVKSISALNDYPFKTFHLKDALVVQGLPVPLHLTFRTEDTEFLHPTSQLVSKETCDMCQAQFFPENYRTRTYWRV